MQEKVREEIVSRADLDKAVAAWTDEGWEITGTALVQDGYKVTLRLRPTAAPVRASENRASYGCGIAFAVVAVLVILGLLWAASRVQNEPVTAEPYVPALRDDLAICGNVEESILGASVQDATSALHSGQSDETVAVLVLLSASRWDGVPVLGASDVLGDDVARLNRWMAAFKNASTSQLSSSELLVFDSNYLAVRSSCKAAGFSWSVEDGFR